MTPPQDNLPLDQDRLVRRLELKRIHEQWAEDRAHALDGLRRGFEYIPNLTDPYGRRQSEARDNWISALSAEVVQLRKWCDRLRLGVNLLFLCGGVTVGLFGALIVFLLWR